MEWYLKVLKNYVGFDGRARRKEFWMFTLVNMIVIMVFSIIMAVAQEAVAQEAWTILFVLYLFYWIAVLLPSVAVTVRRLHDINKSGWWIVIYGLAAMLLSVAMKSNTPVWWVLSIIGLILFLAMLCTKGDQGDNEYGPDPKANEH